MREIAEQLLSRTRRGWLKARPLFECYRVLTDADIALAESKVGTALPDDLKAWLLLVGYGDINEEFSFRLEWLNRVEQGALRGAVVFAQDSLGNFYAWAVPDECIVFFSRSAPEYAVLSPSFRAFMEELAQRDYKVLEWVDALASLPYNWDA